MNLKQAFAQTLRQQRAKHGFSQEELAHRAGLDRTYISLLERGLRQPTLDTVFNLCKALRWRPSDMVARIEELRRH